MHRGLAIDDMSRIVQQRMNAGASNATRLVRTEMNFVQNRANLNSIKDSGMKYYRFVATLDKRTSATCRQRDGMVFPIEEAVQGSNVPPLHPYCRSTIIGSFGNGTLKGKRVARDDEGKTYHVPADVSYKQWIREVKSDIAEIASRGSRKIFIKDETIENIKGIRYYGRSKVENDAINAEQKALLRFAQQENNSNEVMFLLDGSLNRFSSLKGAKKEINFPHELVNNINQRKEVLLLHNHPGGTSFSMNDLKTFIEYPNMQTISLITNAGRIEALTKTKNYDKINIKKYLLKVCKNVQKMLMHQELNDDDYDLIINNFLNWCNEKEYVSWRK